MNNEDIYVEINNHILCIICLEDLDDNIKNICINCNIKCHAKCLHNWYKSKRKKICPICLKTKNYYEKKMRENNIEENEDNWGEEIEEIEEMEEMEEIEEIEEMEEMEEIEEDINYYLYRPNDRNICYRSVNELCCSSNTGSYILIFFILLYIYSSIF